MPKLRKESLHTSQPSSSVADEQDTSTWKPKILNRSKSILSLAQDFFNLNLDNSTSTKQATDSHKSGGQSSWNPLNSLRGAKETLDRKFSTLTLRGGYAPTHPPVQSLIDENENDSSGKIKRRKSLHSLHQAWGTVGRLTLRGSRSRRAPLEPVDTGSPGEVPIEGSSQLTPLAEGDVTSAKQDTASSSSTETLKLTLSDVSSDLDDFMFDKEDAYRKSAHVEYATALAHYIDEAPQNQAVCSETGRRTQAVASQTPVRNWTEPEHASPHVQWARFLLHNAYAPSVQQTSPSSTSKSEDLSCSGRASFGLDTNSTESAASPLDNYPFETLLFDNVSLLNVNIDEGHHARAKHRQQRYDSLRAGILPSLQRDDNVDVKTYWNIVENVSRMARNVSVQRYEEATVTTTGPGPRYTYRQSQRGADSSNPLNGSVKLDKGKGKAADRVYQIHYPDEVSGESFVESFHTKDAAIGALFELQGNYDDHVLYDAEQNIYYPQIKGSPNKSEKELNGLRRVWLPMRTIAPFHSIMPSTFNDKFSDPALGFEANDVYLHQQGISDHCAIRGGSKFSADTMRLASRYRVESTSQGFRPESTLTVERLDYISPELLDFQRKEQEHFRKLVESKRSATKQAASHHDGVSPQKTRRNAQTEQMMEGAEQWSFATDSVRRNLDSGYHSIRWNENARTSRAVPNAVVRHYSPPPKFSYPAWGTKATSLSWDISPKTTTTETRADAEAATPSKAAKTRFVRAISYVKCNPETSLNPSFYSSVRKNKVKTIQIFGDAPKAQLQPLTPTIVRPSLALTDRSVSQAITEIDGDFGEPLVRDDSLGSGSEEGSMSTVCDGTERLWRDVELYG